MLSAQPVAEVGFAAAVLYCILRLAYILLCWPPPKGVDEDKQP
jgi:hypothetical protein